MSSSVASMLGIQSTPPPEKAITGILDKALASATDKKPSVSNTSIVPVTGNPIDNDTLLKLTTDVTDIKKHLEGIDSRMKEGFAALLLKINGGKPIAPSEIKLDYKDKLPSEKDIQGQSGGSKARKTRGRRILKKKRRGSRKY